MIEKHERIIQLHLEGKGREEIAKAVGVTPQQISKVLCSNGYRRQPKYTKEKIDADKGFAPVKRDLKRTLDAVVATGKWLNMQQLDQEVYDKITLLVSLTYDYATEKTKMERWKDIQLFKGRDKDERHSRVL